MPRPRIPRIVLVIEEKGVFGNCSCGGEVLFYTDSGVKCSVCRKLYGLWYLRRKSKKNGEDQNRPKPREEWEIP